MAKMQTRRSVYYFSMAVFLLLYAALSIYRYCNAPQTTSSKFSLWPYTAPGYDQPPEFPGGTPAIKDFLKHYIIYPQQAIDKGICGKVFVKFRVNKDSTISDVTILESVHPLLDSEALRVIRLMPKWKPGLLKGNPVPVYTMQPINFRLPPKAADSTTH